jgi:hypothetical protein
MAFEVEYTGQNKQPPTVGTISLHHGKITNSKGFLRKREPKKE